jgi:hypothetical protein
MSRWVLVNAKNLVKSRKERDKSQRDETRLQERAKSLSVKCAYWVSIESVHAFKLSSRYQATTLSMRWTAGVTWMTSSDSRLHHPHHTWEFKIQDPGRQISRYGWSPCYANSKLGTFETCGQTGGCTLCQ